MRNGKYESYKKILLVYYFYYTLAKSDDWDEEDKVLGLQKAKTARLKLTKIPPSSRSDVIKKLILEGLIVTYDFVYTSHTRRVLTEKGIKETIKIMQ